MAEDIAGPYESHTRQEWENATLSALVHDASIKAAINGVSISHSGKCNCYFGLRLHPAAPRPLIDTWEREGLLVNGQQLRVGYHFEQQPPGTIRVLVMNLPAPFGVCGIVRTLLTCAGYTEAEGMVAQEFLGSFKVGRSVVPGIGRMDHIVAYVRPPVDDHLLDKLPESFMCPDTPAVKVVIMVDGRKSGSLRRPVPTAALATRLAAAGPNPSRRLPAPPPPPPRPSQARSQGAEELSRPSGVPVPAAAAGGVRSHPTWHAGPPPLPPWRLPSLGSPPVAIPCGAPVGAADLTLGVSMEVEGNPLSPAHP